MFLHLVLLLCIPLALTAPPSLGAWKLVLEDDFSTFNHSLWTKGWTWCNPKDGCSVRSPIKEGDTCYFPDEAAYVEDGKLVLETKRQPMGGYNFTSGVVTSAVYNASQGYPCHFGYYETRMKSSLGGWEGLCPAFWFPNTDCPTGKYCEIDIEIPGGKCCGEGAKAWFTVRGVTGDRDTYVNCTQDGKGYCSDDFHTYGMLWQTDIICFYFDNMEAFCTKDEIPQTVGWMVFDNEMGLAGEEWAGYPTDDTPFPQKMYVDWVRVWKSAPVETDVSA